MIENTNKTFDRNGREIEIGMKVKRTIYAEGFYSEVGKYVAEVASLASDGSAFLVVKGSSCRWRSTYFEVVEGKEYRLAVFNKETPIIICCNHREFQTEMEQSPGFVRWHTEWIEW